MAVGQSTNRRTAGHDRPFDFVDAMTKLCVDLCDRVEALAHIDMDYCLVTVAQARRRTPWGVQAKLTPLRFENGSETTVRQGKIWTCQKVIIEGRPQLYLVTFYLPRFQDQTPREKLVTVVHELYHISPEFNGDIRRFAGRCHAHTGSQAKYDEHMGVLVDEWLSCNPPKQLYNWLSHPFDELSKRHGGVTGIKIAIPKLIPVAESAV